jgi:ABC-2 type transport system ATP-binding protein
MIRVEQFSKAYGDFLAVSDLSFEVAAGNVLGLIGPNGAGKTTTLRALSGVIPPTSGRLLIDGHDINRDPLAAKSKLAIVPDEPNLFPSLTVWEHIVFVSRIYYLDDDWPTRANALLEEFDLASRKDTLADELSRGMRQKVAVTCALVHRPQVLILDEPLTGLDPRGIRTLFESIARVSESGTSTIISSHLLGQLEGVCSRFLILNHGKRIHYGTPSEIRRELPTAAPGASLEELFFMATESLAQEQPSDTRVAGDAGDGERDT